MTSRNKKNSTAFLKNKAIDNENNGKIIANYYIRIRSLLLLLQHYRMVL